LSLWIVGAGVSANTINDAGRSNASNRMMPPAKDNHLFVVMLNHLRIVCSSGKKLTVNKHSTEVTLPEKKCRRVLHWFSNLFLDIRNDYLCK
jgi:hypothetical protein